MKYRKLSRLDWEVSILSYGASALGGVFGDIREETAIKAVHAALEGGINYLDVSPAYGATQAEAILGLALSGIPRGQYLLSTKVGKALEADSVFTFDYSDGFIRQSLEQSMQRLHVDYLDIVLLHDIEYRQGIHIEQALGEGLDTLRELQEEGICRYVGVATYPMDLWHRILDHVDVDVVLVHNHYCLNDTLLLELLPKIEAKNIALISASPFAMGLLTQTGPADWFPIREEQKAVLRNAINLCREQHVPIEKIALQFSLAHPGIPTTLMASASPDRIRQNLQWVDEPFDEAMAMAVQKALRPIYNYNWNFGDHF